jgi:phosphoribosyl 1,2-cyclic phosphate phosphodiesterase
VSILVESGGTRLLIDTAPDMREQLLDAQVNRLDAILYTHDHADHTQGIDDVRFLREDIFRGPPLPVYGTRKTLSVLTRRFDYIFAQAEGGSSRLYKPFLIAREIEDAAVFTVKDVQISAFKQAHGMGTVSTGYRIGDMAYCTDVMDFPLESKAQLGGLRLWIVDCLRFAPHLTHAYFDRVLDWVEEFRPMRTVLTHLNESMDYEAVRRRCPPGVEPAYDGLCITI